jgi:hypothetical protein
LGAVDTQRTAYKTQIAPLMALLRGYIESSAGSASDVFIDMGFAMRTATPPTVHTAAAAVEKRRATRAARRTKGKKQLKAIRGVVEASAAAPGAPEGAVLTPSTD